MNKFAKELLRKNNTREKEIVDENEEIYTNMIVYLRSSDLTDYNQEVVRGDIIELILDAQQRGDNIQKVMGNNYKEICDEIIEVMPKKTKKDKIMEFIGTSLNALSILGVIALVKNFIEGLISSSGEFKFILKVGDLMSAFIIILIAYAIVLFITKTALDTKEEKKLISFLKTWGIFTLIFAVILFSSIYFKTIIMIVPLWLAAIFVLLIFIFGKIVSERT